MTLMVEDVAGLPGPADLARRHLLRGRTVGRPEAAVDERSPRRIWEVDPVALFIVMGVLLRRSDLAGVLGERERREVSGRRHDVLLLEAVSGCACPGSFAESMERVLERRTGWVRRVLCASPMFELASWWESERAEAPGKRLAGFLWALASDRRRVVRSLFERVRGQLFVQALDLLGRRRARSHASTPPSQRA